MQDIEKEARIKLADDLALMTEKILRRIPPFDAIPVYREVSYYFYYYLKYFNEIDLDFREKVLLAMIDSARYRFRKRLFNDIPTFDITHPQHLQTKNIFKEWIHGMETDINSINNTIYSPSNNPSNTIKAIMKQRKPDFAYRKAAFNVPGCVPFISKISIDLGMLLVFDLGTHRSTMNVLVGIDKPGILFDIAEFYAHTQSSFEYKYLYQLERSLEISIDIVNQLFPYVLERMRTTVLQ